MNEKSWRWLSPRAVAIAAAAGVLLLCALGFVGVTADVTRHSGLWRFDGRGLAFVIAHRTGAVLGLARHVTELGAAPLLGVIALGASAYLLLCGANKLVAAAPPVALLVAGAAVWIGKSVIGRHAPSGGTQLYNGRGHSFPSGHATDATAVFVATALVAAVFLFRRPVARASIVVVALAASASVGVSRVVLGVHWPTDVVAGWFLGLFVAVAVTLTVAALRRFSRSGSAADVP